MPIRFCSFNCKGFSNSKIKHINNLLLNCEILLLQETWLLNSQIGTINRHFSDFNTYGVSGMKENVLITGRPYGGCSFLYHKSLSPLITFIELNSKRVCCLQIKIEHGLLYVFNVYMPCDSTNNDNLQEYNETLSIISTCMSQHKINYCVIAGDLNTDLTRIHSGNSISLNTFVEKENLGYVLKKIASKVQFTFTGIKDNHSLIDHFIVSENLLNVINDYYTEDFVDNLSDHLPLYCHLSCNNVMHTVKNNVTHEVNYRLHWERATKEHIIAYQQHLNDRLQSFSLPAGITNCKSTDNCSHKLDIVLYHDKIIDALTEAMMTQIVISPKSSNSAKKNVIPGWDNTIDCAREVSLLWHYIWVQCERPTTGIVYKIMQKCRSDYHYMLRLLKKKKNVKIRTAISQNILSSNNKTYWKNVKSIRKNNFNTTSTVDGHSGNVEISNHFQNKFESLFNSVNSSKENLDSLYDCMTSRIENECNSVCDDKLHCHVIYTSDVTAAIKKLKIDKIDEEGIVLSNNFINGTDTLFGYISTLFTAMICHSFAPSTFLHSTMIPIPKGSRVNLSDSEKYRSIAISSLMSKILDNVIIERQAISLATSNYQFGFKSKSSTSLCSTMVNETIQYYLDKNGQSVYLLLLDASKAFDKVSYEMLFMLLLERNVCPRIIKLLYFMYTNQLCYVKWQDKRSDSFNVSNGVKQGSVISPLLFSIYVDNLFSKLAHLGLGCHVGLTYAGAFGYADDIALISPSLYGLKKMIHVCESYAEIYHITFNPSKTKLLCFNTDPTLIPPIYLNNEPISIVTNEKHLGNFISTDIRDRNMLGQICDFYQCSNSVISDFRVCDSITLDKLHSTFCMYMYGCELWNLTCGAIDNFKIAWRKVKRRIWKLPPLTHNIIVHNLSIDISLLLEKRMLKFIFNALNHSLTCSSLLHTVLNSKHSSFADNFRYLSYKYHLEFSDWHRNLNHLMGKVKMKFEKLYPCQPEVNILLELCEMRDSLCYDCFTNVEINKLIDDICLN